MGLKISRHGRSPGTRNRSIAPRAVPGFQPRNGMAAAVYYHRKQQRAENQVPLVGFDLTVGTDATSYGFSSGAYGAVNPSSLNGLDYAQITVTTGDAAVVAFAGGAQQGDATTLSLSFEGFNNGAPIDLAWSGGATGSYEGTATGFLAFLTGENGNTIPFNVQLFILIAATTMIATTTMIYYHGVAI